MKNLVNAELTRIPSPSSAAADWLYDKNIWGIMANYIPKLGEWIGVMITAGSERSDSHFKVMERTGIVLIPFPKDNMSIRYPPFSWQEN